MENDLVGKEFVHNERDTEKRNKSEKKKKKKITGFVSTRQQLINNN